MNKSLILGAFIGATLALAITAVTHQSHDKPLAPETRRPVLHMTCWIDDTVSFRLYNLTDFPQTDGNVIKVNAPDRTDVYRLAEREHCATADRAFDDELDVD